MSRRVRAAAINSKQQARRLNHGLSSNLNHVRAFHEATTAHGQPLTPDRKTDGARSHALPPGKAFSGGDRKPPAEASKSRLSIRDELRAWATSDSVPEITNRPQDVSLSARVTNLITRVGGRITALDEDSTGSQMFDSLRFGQDEDTGVVGAGDRQVGDLVLLMYLCRPTRCL